jgi:hypothetical protein
VSLRKRGPPGGSIERFDNSQFFVDFAVDFSSDFSGKMEEFVQNGFNIFKISVEVNSRLRG